jgi:oligopeptide transport system substrate-binding protein
VCSLVAGKRRLRRIVGWLVPIALVIVAVSTGGGKVVGSASSSQRDLRIYAFGSTRGVGTGGFDDRDIVAQLFERLTDVDPYSRVVPALAESWTIDPGARHIVFTLRAGLTFSDGSALTAEDVVRSWMWALDPANDSPSAYLLFDVEGAGAHARDGTAPVGITAPDHRTVDVSLVNPANDFPAIVANPWLGVVGPKFGGFDGLAGQVTSGAYRMGSDSADEVVLDANPHYWAGPPAIGHVRFVYALGNRDPVAALRSNRVDVSLLRESDAAFAGLDSKLGPNVLTETVPMVVYYGFSTERRPFDDARVRRAFAEAVDWKHLVSLFPGIAAPATGPVPPEIPGAPSVDRSPAYDPDQARSLLAEAGYPGGAGFPTVTFQTNGFAWDRLVMDEWTRQLGVHVSAETSTSGALLDRSTTSGPVIWALTWQIDYPAPDDFLGVLAGVGQPNNFAKWSSADFDAAIDQARSAGDAAGAAEGFDRAAAILQDQVPMFAVAYGEPLWELTRDGLAGMARNGLGVIRLAGVRWTS